MLTLAVIVLTANAVPPPAGVAPVLVPQGGFSIQGGLSAGVPSGTGDWLASPKEPACGILDADGVPLNPSLTFHFVDPFDEDADPTFAGGLKWMDAPGAWTWTTGKASAKTDINNVLMHLAEDKDGHTWLILAADRLSTSGDSYIDFELLQSPVFRTDDGGFRSTGTSGGRTVNDIVLSLAFVNGGSLADFYAWRWMPTADGFGYVNTTASLPTDRVFLVANTNEVFVPFGAFGMTNYAPNAFVEAAIDLTALLGNFDPCLSIGVKSVMVKTKTSQSDSATINDFIDPIQISMRIGPSADAGPDQAACSDGGPTAFTLHGVANAGLFPSSSTTWSLVSGEAKIVTPDALETKVFVTSESATLRLTVQQGNGCTDTDEVVLAAVLRPEAPAISGPTIACPASFSEFSAPPGFAQYRWTITGNGSIVGSAEAPTVTVGAGAHGASFSLMLTVVSNICVTSSRLEVGVNDTEPPRLACPPDLVLQYPAETGTNMTGVAVATDNCGTAIIGHSDAVVVLPAGAKRITRTWTASDASGNSAEVIQTIVITVTEPTPPPVIIGGPESQTVPVGGNASFTVVASGESLFYQWQHNGSNIAGATTSVLNLSDLQLAEAGTYTVLVSNAGGSVSGGASLNVTTGGTMPPPVILSGPQSQVVPPGSDVALTVQAEGNDLTYQWQHEGTNIVGATDNSLVRNDVDSGDAGTYTVIVSNAGGSVTSSATVDITPGEVVRPPVIVIGPQSQTASVGGNVRFTVQASGEGALEYQWQHNGNNLAGATGSALNLSNLQLVDAGTYIVIVSNAGGSVSGSASLSVTTGGAVPPPVITHGPDSQTVPAGTDLTLTVEATGDDLTYQWQQDGINILGATNSSLALTNAGAGDSGNYTVVVSNPGGSTTSDPASIVVIEPPPPPVIIRGPESQTVLAGGHASFAVVAGGEFLTYVWQHDGSVIAGATTSVLNLSNVQPTEVGTYTVLVSNAGGSVSGSANLNVTIGGTVQPPVILAGPQSQVVPPGSDVALTVLAGGSDLTYQWQHEGTNIAGATDNSLVRTDVNSSDAGTYTVIVSNAGGSATSSATLTVTTGSIPQAPVIISGPESQTVLAGGNASFTVVASGESLTYQWQHDGSNISGATTSILNLSGVQLAEVGTYTVLVSNTGGSTSGSATLNVTAGAPVQLPVILSGPQSQNVPWGADVVMSVVATNGTLTYQWRYFGQDIAGATASSLILPSVQFTNAGLYDVVVANAESSVLSPTAILNVLPTLSGEYNDHLLTLTWPGPFILQEAPECTGPFSDIVSAVTPYIVDTRLAPRKFFRLRAIDFNLQVTYLEGGEASVSVTGVPGLTFILQASSDLVSWMNIHTNTAPATYVDDVPSQGVLRFYRVIPSWSMISITRGAIIPVGKAAVTSVDADRSVSAQLPRTTKK